MIDVLHVRVLVLTAVVQEIELVEKLAVALRVLMDEAESRSADRTQRLLSPHVDLQEKNKVNEELAADADLRSHVRVARHQRRAQS